MRQLEVVVYNGSSDFGHIILYQLHPHTRDPEARPLVWLAKQAHPGTRVSFRWTETYNFVWFQTEKLTSGVVVEASQILAADPADPRLGSVRLLCRNDALTFARARSEGTEGSLLMEQDDSVPPGIASVGIGMNGHAVLVVPARPNRNLIVKPSPAYFVAFGCKNQGEVLDPVELTQPAELRFPHHVHRLTATLSRQNTWSVVPFHTAPDTVDDPLLISPGSA